MDAERSLAMMQAWVEHEPEMPKWLDRLSNPGFRRFVLRYVGAGRFDRIERAARADAAIVLVGIRRALRYMLPVATALDQCLGALNESGAALLEGHGQGP